MSAIEELITELARLPGIGRKTAQRLTFHLLQQPSEQVARLASALASVTERVRPCEECGNLTEDQPCNICRDPRRDPGLVCVVEEPSTVTVVDRSTDFRGRYHVLGGHLSPLDGIGPREIHLDRLLARATEPELGGPVGEVIVATNFTSEGEATAHYIGEMLKARGLKVSRLARGVPVGGELEYVDAGTIARAVMDRRNL